MKKLILLWIFSILWLSFNLDFGQLPVLAKHPTQQEIENSQLLDQLLTHQPDFHGYFVSDEHERYSMVYEWARKAGKSRVGRIKCSIQPDCKIENLPAPERVEIRLPNEPVIELWTDSREFSKYKNPKKAVFPGWETHYRKMNFVGVKTERKPFENHDCTVVTVLEKGKKTPLIFYFANDLNGLLIRVEEKWPKSTAIHSLKLVSLDVPESLFEIPADYKELKAKRKK